MKKENKILIFVITAFFALIIASMAVYMTPYLIAYRTVENCLSENEKKLMDKDSKIEKGKMNSKLSKSEKKEMDRILCKLETCIEELSPGERYLMKLW